MAVDRLGRSPNRPEPKRDRREISRNRLPTQTPQAGRQDRSAASCDDRRRRNPVVRPSIHPKPSKVMESEIRENHQVFRRVQVYIRGDANWITWAKKSHLDEALPGN